MKSYIRTLFIFLILFVGLIGTSQVYAMTPSLSFSSYYSGSDTVLLAVSGDPNSLVTIYYTTISGLQTRSLGTTNNGGFFSTTLNTRDYAVSYGVPVYVVVNGQQSSSVAWPNYGSSNLSFNQNTLSLSVGQSSLISAYNSSGSLYVSSNSNPSVVTVSTNGSVVSFYGQVAGSSTVVICQSPSNVYCGTIYVVVGGGHPYPIYNTTGLSITSLMIPSGGTATISGASSGIINISSNTNPSVASATAGSYSSSVIISGISIGSTTLTLCQNNTNVCNSIIVTVTGVLGQQIQNQSPGSSCWFTRTLRYGMSGEDVYCLQSYLINEGYLTSGNISSYFDGETREAVISYQWNHGLKPDGVVGRSTRYELLY